MFFEVKQDDTVVFRVIAENRINAIKQVVETIERVLKYPPITINDTMIIARLPFDERRIYELVEVSDEGN